MATNMEHLTIHKSEITSRNEKRTSQTTTKNISTKTSKQHNEKYKY
jgi:hypothetical protein